MAENRDPPPYEIIGAIFLSCVVGFGVVLHQLSVRDIGETPEWQSRGEIEDQEVDTNWAPASP